MALCNRCRGLLMRNMFIFRRLFGDNASTAARTSQESTAFEGPSGNGSPNCRSSSRALPERLGGFSWLKEHARGFPVSGENVNIIHDPSQFYNTLKSEASLARKRIIISSLYLGTGKLEQDLVDTIHENLKLSSSQDDAQPKVEILLDYTRGYRGKHNSVTMLLPLLKNFQDNVQISLYHTPNLRGIWKWAMPERYNEIIGVQHMKVYLFDDNLVISGANLSDSYFTNRQDRYIMLRNCPALCDFFENLVHTVSSVSFTVLPDNTVRLPENLKEHPFKGNHKGKVYKQEASEKILPIITPQKPAQSPDFPEHPPATATCSGGDTWVFPSVQMGPFKISVDDTITQKFFTSAVRGARICLASGYFNLTEHYKNLIVNDSQADFDILMAAPEVNGFFGAKGPAGGIPHAYTNIAKQFFHVVKQKQQEGRIRMHEFYRDAWTFHAKGLWHYAQDQHLPNITFIGSPNFGYRSFVRDLEVQLVVVTENKQLQEKLHQERLRLYQRSEEVTDGTFAVPDRKVPLWVRLVTTFFKNFF